MDLKLYSSSSLIIFLWFSPLRTPIALRTGIRTKLFASSAKTAWTNLKLQPTVVSNCCCINNSQCNRLHIINLPPPLHTKTSLTARIFLFHPGHLHISHRQVPDFIALFCFGRLYFSILPARLFGSKRSFQTKKSSPTAD